MALDPSSSDLSSADPAAAAPAVMPSATVPRGARIPLGSRKITHNQYYSRWVSTLKLILPTTAFSLIALVILWPLIAQQEQDKPGILAELSQINPDNLIVENARYNSTEQNGNPYTITADLVEQADIHSPIVALTNPKADIELKNGSWAAITADNGLLNKDSQILELEGSVSMFHDSGYEFRTDAATVDLLGGNAFGFIPVRGQGPYGFITGEGFRIHDRGIRFEVTGKSRLIIYEGVTQ